MLQPRWKQNSFGWKKESLDKRLALAKDFRENNDSFSYQNPQWAQVKSQKDLLKDTNFCSDQDSEVKISREMILHETGLGFVLQKYQFATPLKTEYAFIAYKDICHGYFVENNLNWCKSYLKELKAKLRDAKVVPRKEFRSIQTIPEGETFYWTHGVVYCTLPKQEFTQEKLKEIIPVYSSNQEVKISTMQEPSTIAVGSGWETTGIVMIDNDKAQISIDDINRFMVLLTYIYVMHRILEKITTLELHELHENFSLKQLRILRRFRISTNLLLGDYTISRFIMPERYLDIMSNCSEAWYLDSMRAQVENKSKLLNLAYTQLQDEENTKQQKHFNIIILVLTIVSVIGVSAEVSSFLFGVKDVGWMEKILYLTTPYMLIAIVFGTLFLFRKKD